MPVKIRKGLMKYRDQSGEYKGLDGISQEYTSQQIKAIQAAGEAQLSGINSALQAAKDSGEFDGPQGPKGDPGDTGPQGPQGPKGVRSSFGVELVEDNEYRIVSEESTFGKEVEELKSALNDIDNTIDVLGHDTEIAPKGIGSSAENVDLDVTDNDGNVLLRLADGHIQTKNFDSRSVDSDVTADPTSAENVDLDVTDASGNVIGRFVSGHIQTKNFHSKYTRQLSGKKWVVIGDSLTEHNQRATKNYHDYVAEETGVTVVNLGRSGRGYGKVAGGMSFIGISVNIPSDADVITIFGSGNDMSAGLEVGVATDSTSATLCGCINLTLDAICGAFPLVPIGVITPTPWIRSEPSDGDTKMAQYCEKIVEICALRGIPCLDLYHCSNLHPNDAVFRELAYSRDEGNGVHPDETGHKIIAPRFREFLFTLI